MKVRINTNSFKNAMGTVFLLAAAFFVCSTFLSMRSVFADPIAMSDASVQQSGRQSPRSTSRTSNRTISRATVSRATTPTTRNVASRAIQGRNVAQRSGVQNKVSTTSRNVVSRNNVRQNRAVRARTAVSSPSRVSATGSVMTGNRASVVSTTGTNYTYLSSKLYNGNLSSIVDSSTGLISADAYSSCLESYYTCMDEICTARSDTKGRCSCAGRALSFLQAEEQLESANEELIKLSGQLSLLIATKGKGDDLSSAFSLTDAEKVMNCVSYKDARTVAGTTKDSNGNLISKEVYMNEWCKSHMMYGSEECSYTQAPKYCSKSGNDFNFDISKIDGSSSDIIAQLKAWADAKDLAKQYTTDDSDSLINSVASISSLVTNATVTINATTPKAELDSLANKWGYKLFEYAHNNVCGRVLDACFNGIYEACGNPGTFTDSDGEVRMKCANSATTNCPFNYNSYIKVNEEGEVVLNDRSTGNTTLSSSASCFGYTTTTTTTGTRATTTTSTDPYVSLRGPVADARRSIMQKYLLDANSACDVYGTALKNTAQNINYQKIAAEQALQQKRLEFKQEEENRVFAEARSAIDNFNECISEIWDCYREYEDEDKWTTARIKAYCTQVSQVPHCYETMICAPVQTQLVAVVDVPDKTSCSMVDNSTNEYIYGGENACRNVVTISEILYGTGASSDKIVDLTSFMNGTSSNIQLTNLNSAGVREGCLQMALGCQGNNTNGASCLRKWKQGDTTED